MSLMSPRILNRAITSAAAMTLAAVPALAAAAPTSAAPPLPPAAGAAAAASPTAPTGLAVTARAPRQLTATWQPPTALNGATVTDYAVTFRTTTAANPSSVTLLSGGPDVREVTATGLTAGITYAVTVVARSDAGDSVPSPEATESAYDAPYFQPGSTYVSGYQIKPEAHVWLMWSAANGNGADIAGYEVWSSTDAQAPVATVSGPTTFVKLVDVPTGVPITYTVTAVTEHGLRTSVGPSNPIVVMARPSAPRAVTAVAGVESIRASWLPPADTGGGVDHYVVTIAPGSAEIVIPGDETQVDLNLSAGTAYTVSVAALNGVGSSPIASAAPVTPTAPTPTTTPTTPTTPTPTPTTPTPTPTPTPNPTPHRHRTAPPVRP